MQKYANIVELDKCCQTHIFFQNFVLIQPRTSPPKICKILPIFPILRFSGGRARPSRSRRCRGSRGTRRRSRGRSAPRAGPRRRPWTFFEGNYEKTAFSARLSVKFSINRQIIIPVTLYSILTIYENECEIPAKKNKI